MPQGKKICPNCHIVTGARTMLCSCGYHFPTKKVRKDLLKAKKLITKGPKTYDKEGKGRKRCPKCNTIIAAIYKKCIKCDYDFSILAKEKKAEKETIKAEKQKTREEKQLAKEVAAKEKRKKKSEKQDEYISPLTAMLLQVPLPGEPKKITPRKHANRILKYGEKRARGLLNIAHLNKCWKHVDWDHVEEGLR